LDNYATTEAAEMEQGRYSRNIGAISEAEQEKLGRSRVLIAGCGGIGGGVLSDLLRIGVGDIAAVDFDRFEESNLNRQLLCSGRNIGASKAEAAAAYASAVNPTVKFHAFSQRLDAGSGPALVSGCGVVIDALDSIEDRRTPGRRLPRCRRNRGIRRGKRLDGPGGGYQAGGLRRLYGGALPARRLRKLKIGPVLYRGPYARPFSRPLR
jgi:hypothetical protein